MGRTGLGDSGASFGAGVDTTTGVGRRGLGVEVATETDAVIAVWRLSKIVISCFSNSICFKRSPICLLVHAFKVSESAAKAPKGISNSNEIKTTFFIRLFCR